MELFSFLALATVMVVLTTSIHLGGLAALIALMRWREGHSNHVASAWWQMALILGVVQGLFFLHAVQIWVYAALYRFGGVIESFEEALYFSTSTFTTVGYGDIVLEPGWRVLAGIESANGFLLQVVSRLRSVEFRWLDRREDEAELFQTRKASHTDDADRKP